MADFIVSYTTQEIIVMVAVAVFMVIQLIVNPNADFVDRGRWLAIVSFVTGVALLVVPSL